MYTIYTIIVESKSGRAFACDPPNAGYKARVDKATGEVTVWDSVARHYTSCHNLTPGQIRSIRNRAFAR